MPLTAKGMLYAIALATAAIVTAYLVIRTFGITDDDNQYAVTMGLIFFYIGTFFCRDSIWIGLPKRALWSFILALIVALLLATSGLFFERFFSV